MGKAARLRMEKASRKCKNDKCDKSACGCVLSIEWQAGFGYKWRTDLQLATGKVNMYVVTNEANPVHYKWASLVGPGHSLYGDFYKNAKSFGWVCKFQVTMMTSVERFFKREVPERHAEQLEFIAMDPFVDKTFPCDAFFVDNPAQ